MSKQHTHVCPVWVGYLLLNPLRKLFEHPERLLSPYAKTGMSVLEPGCGPGYFTLPLARMVGTSGRVICADVQEKMLEIVRRRAGEAGLSDRVTLRTVDDSGLSSLNLRDEIDLTVALYMVHEVPEKKQFLADIYQALKPGGKLFVLEPRFHVSRDAFNNMQTICRDIGYKPETAFNNFVTRAAVMTK